MGSEISRIAGGLCIGFAGLLRKRRPTQNEDGDEDKKMRATEKIRNGRHVLPPSVLWLTLGHLRATGCDENHSHRHEPAVSFPALEYDAAVMWLAGFRV